MIPTALIKLVAFTQPRALSLIISGSSLETISFITLKTNRGKENWRIMPICIVKRSKDNFVELVKNTYRVLLSRGMKGCYVYFVDKDTEKFIKTRIE